MFRHIVSYKGFVKVSLGLMQPEYIEDFLPWPNERHGIEGTLLRPPYSHASGVEWVRGLDKQKGVNEVFAILLKEKSNYRYVGHTGVHNVEWPAGSGITGSVIGLAEARGCGCGTEAKLLLQYHAFKVLGLRKLVSRVKAFNAGSLAHLLKCGYQIVGRHRAHRFHEGAYIDEIVLEVFREEWEPIWEKYRQSQRVPSLTDVQKATVRTQTTYTP